MALKPTDAPKMEGMILKYLRKARMSLKAAALGLVLCLWLSVDVAAGGLANGRSSRTLRSMARVYIAFGQYDKAQVLAGAALNQAQSHSTADAELAMCLIDLGTVYQYQDKLDAAEEMLAAGIALQKRAPDRNPYIAYTLRMLSSVCRRQQQYEKAQAILDEAMAIMLEDHLPDDAAVGFFRTEQAKLLTDQGQLEQARDIYRTAIKVIESAYGEDHLCTANVCEDMAVLDLRRGSLEDAKILIDRTIGIREKYYGAGHRMIVSAWFVKARIRRAEGDFFGSEQIIEKVLKAAARIKDPVQLAKLHQQASQIRRDVQLARL